MSSGPVTPMIEELVQDDTNYIDKISKSRAKKNAIRTGSKRAKSRMVCGIIGVIFLLLCVLVYASLFSKKKALIQENIELEAQIQQKSINIDKLNDQLKLYIQENAELSSKAEKLREEAAKESEESVLVDHDLQESEKEIKSLNEQIEKLEKVSEELSKELKEKKETLEYMLKH